MNLGNKISEIRKKNKMSQEEFAELFNVTRQTISSWENSKSYPDIETLIKISDKFNISLDILLKEDKVMIKKIDKERKNYKIIKADASSLKEDNYDVIVVDPPRSGLNKKVISTLNKIKPKKLIYISCNPSTLKRDINLLHEYKLLDLKVFNMFPCTGHIECICILNLR